jgi:hypothetical protein
MTVAYPNVADRLFGRAHAIEPNALRAIVEGPIGQRVLAGERIEIKRGQEGAKLRRGASSPWSRPRRSAANDGLSRICADARRRRHPVDPGVISKRFDWLAAACGFATYEGLSASLALGAGLSRPRVLLDVDSPGGQVDGMLDFADKILAARKDAGLGGRELGRRFRGLCAGRLGREAVSAAARPGRFDRRGDDARRPVGAGPGAGVKYSAIFSGARKIDGWDHAALSSEARGLSGPRRSLPRCAVRPDRPAGPHERQGGAATEAAVYSDADAVKLPVSPTACRPSKTRSPR